MAPLFVGVEGRLGKAAGGLAGTLAGEELDEPVDCEAQPEIDDEAEVEPVGGVAGGDGQVGHEDKQVKQVADDDGGELLEEAGEHSCWRREAGEELRERSRQPSAAGGRIQFGDSWRSSPMESVSRRRLWLGKRRPRRRASWRRLR